MQDEKPDASQLLPPPDPMPHVPPTEKPENAATTAEATSSAAVGEVIGIPQPQVRLPVVLDSAVDCSSTADKRKI